VTEPAPTRRDTARPLLLSEASLGQSSAIVSLSLLLTALVGAAQGLLLVFIVGEGDRTDAFLAAYSLYLVLTLFGASLRGSLVPLFGHPESEQSFRERVAGLTARIVLIGLVALAGMLLVSPAAGQLMTLGLPSDARWTAVFSLLILAPAAYFQIHAAAISAALSAARRFTLSAAIYVAAGVLALGVSAALLALIGVLGAAIGLLAGAALLAAAHDAYLRRFGVRLRPRVRWLGERAQRELAVSLIAGAAIGLALQLYLALALAVLSSDPGAITSYSYAFFAVSVMLAVSSSPLTLVTLPDLVSRIAERGQSAAEEQLERVAPYAYAVLAPLLLAFAAFGHPLLDAVFADSLSDRSIDLLYEIGLVLELMAIPNALLFLTWAVTLAIGRYRRSLVVAAIGLAVQAAGVVSLSTLGPHAVAAAHSGALAVTAAALLAATYGRRWLGVAARALRRSAPAFALALVYPLARLAFGDDLGVGAALAGVVAATIAYVALAIVAWPSVSAAFVDLVRRRPANAGASADG
jgi:putative peptidoglycan lipid II flippase